MTNEQGVAGGFKSEQSTVSSYLKGVDFDNGLDVVVVSMEKFTPTNPDYGIKNTYGAGGIVTKENWFVKQGILKEGESFKYTFGVDGVKKEFDNNSLSFYFAFTKVDPKAGDKLNIHRNKKSATDVVWSITDIK
jgi:hypothetical protein